MAAKESAHPDAELLAALEEVAAMASASRPALTELGQRLSSRRSLEGLVDALMELAEIQRREIAALTGLVRAFTQDYADRLGVELPELVPAPPLN